MNRLFTVVAALLALLSSASAEAKAPSIQVTVSVAEEGVAIRYDLPAPVTSLVLGDDDRPWPSDASLAEPGLRIERRTIIADQPFRRATLLITPDTRDVDARYPVLTRVEGRGYALFAPYVLPASGAYRLRVGTGGSRSRSVPAEEARGGYLIVGARPRAADAFSYLSGTDIDAAAEAFLHGRVARLISFYESRLGRRLDRRPTIIVTRRAPAAGFSGFRGDVTRNNVVLLSFRGTPPTPADPKAAGRVTGFLAHEIFHLWNAPGGDAPQTDAWLHEGSAEYYSWLATAALWPDEIKLEQRLQSAWNACMIFAGTRPVAQMQPRSRYTCGALAHWAVDLGVRHASSGARDGFHLWSKLLGAPGGGYDLPSFRAAAAEHAPRTVALLTAFIETGWDWPQAARQLSEAGAEVHAGPPTPMALRFAVARVIGTSICSQFSGAGETSTTYYMRAEDCGDGLRGDVHLLSVNGLDPMGDAQLLYDKVRGICGERGALELTLRGAGEPVPRTAGCTIPVPPAVPQVTIKRALPLNPPARSAP